MRKSRAIALGIAALGIAGYVTIRTRGGNPAADSTPARDSTAIAPPPLSVPGLAPAPARAHARTDGAPPASAVDASKPTAARIQGTVVSAETGTTIPSLRFHLAFRKKWGETPRTLDVETGLDGSFAGDLEIAEPIPLTGGWCDRSELQFRGYVRTTGEGLDPSKGVEARPGETLGVTIRMARLATFAGVVVDERGAPLPGTRVKVFHPGPNEDPVGSSIMTEARADGSFTVRAIEDPDHVASAATAGASSRLTIEDFSPTMRPSISIDLRTIPVSDRERMRIVFGRGRRVRGRLVDESGRPIGASSVVATCGDPSRLRSARTDDDGRFTLETLSDGPVTIGQFFGGDDLEARLDVTLTADLDDVVLVARPIESGDAARGIVVLGARLLDVTDEVRISGGLRPEVHVVVVDRGAGGGFGDEAGVGTGILTIGDSKVVDVAHLVDLVLAESELAAKRNPQFPMIRIVTTCGEGTNTQNFSLSPGSIEHLKRLEARLRKPR